jgi:hypothetical protein
MQEVRYACRALARSRGFAAIAALTLGLGIGSNVAIFSLVRAVLLPDLPYRDPSRLAQIHEHNLKSGEITPWVNFRDTADFRESRAFESIAMYRLAMLATAGGVRPESIYGAIATPNLLPLLGVAPAMGRFLEGAEGGAEMDEIVLADDFWRRCFAADPAIVGKKIRLLGYGGNEWRVVGVMPPGFNFPLTIPSAIQRPTAQMQFWIGFPADPRRYSRDGVTMMTVGRLRPRVLRDRRAPGARLPAD